MTTAESQGALAGWRTLLSELIEANTDHDTIRRVIGTSDLDSERQAVLWLWAWSRHGILRGNR